VANSEFLAQLSLAADPFGVEIIPNGVDPVVFAPATASGTGDDEFRILFVGRLHSQKNVAGLIESAVALAALDGPPVVLEIVGDGPERHALEQLAKRARADLSIRWHGWLGKEDVLACYRRAHVFVNPSSSEGMPNTVLEAMACAIPVVASDIGGHQKLVVDGETGLLFDLDTPHQLTTVLQRLRLDPPLGAALGARGRHAVIEGFSWPRVAEQYIRLLAPRT
jgi:glycosyltransferase involved in cell wall biosynthesis